MHFLTSISSIADRYTAFLLDLWGVIHDGEHLYPGARECVQQLRQRGKKIVFLSNAPRRAFKAQVVLDRLGVEPDLYDAILTSGEAGYKTLEEGRLVFGEQYLFIGPSRDEDVLNGLPYRAVPSVKQADFLLNVGFGSEQESTDAWDGILKEALGRKLPMLCLNPDFEVVKICGRRFPCAGVLAKTYEQMGGDVFYIGKPYPEVYRRALALLGIQRKAEVLAVGDALHTDILGARNMDIFSVLVTGGILRQQLGDVSTDAIRTHLAKEEVQPDYVIPGLHW